MEPQDILAGTRDPGVRLLVQFQRIEQLLSGLPGARSLDDSAEAAALAVPVPVLKALRAEFRAEVGRRAQDLFADPAISAYCARLPLGPDACIVCLGDSMTSDFQSWAEMLGCVLRRHRPDLAVVNEGRSGDTTTDLLSRFAAAVPPHRPSLVVVLIGANDGRQHAPWPSEPEVSDTETARNAGLLQSMIHGLGARSVWITPPPVIDGRVRAHPVLGAMPARYDDATSARKAAAIAGAAHRSVDLRQAFLSRGPGGLLLDDGLHPSGAGQALITAVLLNELASPGGSERPRGLLTNFQ
jgi:lysophospholipase L1-like esterase